MCRAFLPGMIERGAGDVINLASVSGKRPRFAALPTARPRWRSSGSPLPSPSRSVRTVSASTRCRPPRSRANEWSATSGWRPSARRRRYDEARDAFVSVRPGPDGHRGRGGGGGGRDARDAGHVRGRRRPLRGHGRVTAPPLKGRVRDGEQLLGVLLRMPAEETRGDARSGRLRLPGDRLRARTGRPRRCGSIWPSLNCRGWPCSYGWGTAEPASCCAHWTPVPKGVIAPHIDTVEQATALVDSAHYPPVGHRGFATYGRAGRFGGVEPAEHLQLRAEHLVFGMIESPSGSRMRPTSPRCRAWTASWSAPRTCGRRPRRRILTRSRPYARCTRCSPSAEAYGWTSSTALSRPRRLFADGAQLVVYNLTATLMDH